MVAKEINFHTVDVDGTKINFPFEPYELQISYMKKVPMSSFYKAEQVSTLVPLWLGRYEMEFVCKLNSTHSYIDEVYNDIPGD